MRRADSRKRRPSRLWHRWLGFALVLPLLFISVTGVLLNHVDQLGWDAKPTRSQWILSHYNMALEGNPITFQSGGLHVSEWGGQLFWNGESLPIRDDLVGVAELQDGVAVVSPRSIRLFNAEGTLIDALSEMDLPEGAFARAGLDAEGRLVVQAGEGGDWVFSPDLLDYTEHKATTVTWSAPGETSDSARQAMQDSYRGEGLSWARVLLDLHSGRFFGSVGRWIVDLFVVLLVILSVTGLMVGIRVMTQRTQGDRHG